MTGSTAGVPGRTLSTKIGAGRPRAIADDRQQHVGRRLQDRQAKAQMNQVLAGDDAVQADQQQPGRHGKAAIEDDVFQ